MIPKMTLEEKWKSVVSQLEINDHVIKALINDKVLWMPTEWGVPEISRFKYGVVFRDDGNHIVLVMITLALRLGVCSFVGGHKELQIYDKAFIDKYENEGDENNPHIVQDDLAVADLKQRMSW